MKQERHQHQEKLLNNVRRSAETARKVLVHLESSLKRGGFAEGVDSYQQMAHTLTGQCLWVQEHGDEQLEQSFVELSDIAGRVYELLAPYTASMQRLALMRSVVHDSDSQDIEDMPAGSATVLRALSDSSTPLSASALRQSTGLSSRQLRTLLKDLCENGSIRKLGTSTRTLYSRKADE